MKTVQKITKYSVGIISLLIILAITMLTILLEPAIKIKGFTKLDADKLPTSGYSITMLDNTDNPIDNAPYIVNSFTPIELVKQQTRDAFISIEDKRFHSHNGIDPIRIVGALKNDIASLSLKEGASTITQQLVKITHLSPEKTANRKLQEMRIARDIERKFTKDKILEIYLNALQFGGNIIGIGNASYIFFEKSVPELSLTESALLAAVINNPARFNPMVNPENVKNRRDLVLRRMRDNGKITEDEYAIAISQEIAIKSHFIQDNSYDLEMLNEAAEILNCPLRELLKRNLTVATCFHPKYQTAVDSVIQNAVLPDSVLRQAIVMDNATGQILAATGETGIKRQPGSTVKPFVSYAPAIERRIVYPVTPILDLKTSFAGYAPSNYRDRYDGWTTVEKALSKSSNICAVKLLEMTGIEYAKSFAEKCGFEFGLSDTGLPIALGGMEQGLSLTTLANAYQALANNGKIIKSNRIRYIKNENGEIIYKKNYIETRVMSDITAYFVNRMLSLCAKEGTAQRLDGITNNICGKTGTVGDENGNTDAYCIAYNPEYTVAVWIGSKDNQNPHNFTGGGMPAFIAREIFQSLESKKSSSFHRPASVKNINLDATEYYENHRLILAEDSLPPRYCKPAEFPEYNLPQKKTPLIPYMGGQNQSFTFLSEIKSEPYPYPKFPDSPAFINPNNYEIIA